MKKTLLTLALGLAILPLTFAQTTPAAPPATGGQNEGAAPAKKHVKKHRKAKKTTATKKAPATPANPSN